MRCFLITSWAICCLLVSCAPYGNRENYHLFGQARLLAEQMPDSALILLDAINTASFGNVAKAEYTLLRVQAKDNAGMDITSDTEILQTREYFLRRKNTEKQARACFYAAKVVFGDGQADQATLYFQEAADFAQKSGNTVLQGRALYNMGYLCYSRELYAEAMIRYQQALQLFQSAEGQFQMEIHTLNAMGSALMIQEQTDSAHYYYKTALQQARLHNDANMQVMVYANMGVVYREQGLMDTAKYYGIQALNLTTTDSEKAYIYWNLAHLHLSQNCIDSARYYLEKQKLLLGTDDDVFRLASLYHLYAQIEKTCGNHQKALEYFEIFSNYREELMDRNDRQTLLEMQKKYDSAAQENEYNRTKNRLWMIAGVMAVGLLLLSVTVTVANHRHTRKSLALEKAEREKAEKQLALERVEREKNEAMQELEILQNLYQSRYNAVLEKMGIIKEIALLSKKVDDGINHATLVTSINRITALFTLEKIMDIIDELQPGLIARLKEKLRYAKLTESEICICGLMVCGFTNTEIALFINRDKKTKTIENRKSAISYKLGVEERGGMKKFIIRKITL